MNHHGFGTIDEDIIGPLLKLVDGVLKHAEVEFGSSTLTDSNDLQDVAGQGLGSGGVGAIMNHLTGFTRKHS